MIRRGQAAVLTLLLLAAPAATRAEVVEEIVAFVNGDIITRSDFDQEEKLMVAEAYRRFTGPELDERVRAMRASMLLDMIDRRILLNKAQLMFKDLEAIKKIYYDGFKENQKIGSDAEFAEMLKAEGMTVAQFKDRLLELYAPDEVLRYEVGNRVAIPDSDVDAYYAEHPEEFALADETTVREIVLKAATPDARAARLEEAGAIAARLRAGEDFAAVAAEVSEAPTRDKGGLLGTFQRGELAPALDGLAFSLPVGEVSDPVEADYGIHLLKVDSRRVGEKTPLEEIRPRLRKFIEDRRYNEEVTRYLEKARNEAEWCVRPKYRDRLDAAHQTAVCEN